ncbi:MAG: hypothetical protein HY820_41905 [Acidobacteria bacterium]|nr:hypothetical protein [Acidobacteriota bacterium]
MDDIIRSAERSIDAPEKASSRLKSRILSELILMEQAEGPLRILSQSRAAGEQLCIFEHAVALLPSDDLQSRNPCAVCHARLLGEHVENAPIYWPGCPYSRYCGH